MDNNQFTFRRFLESDADVIYEEYAKYSWSNIQPYFSGPCVVQEKKRLTVLFSEKGYTELSAIMRDDLRNLLKLGFHEDDI